MVYIMAEETFDMETEIFTLTDEEGNESEFELIGKLVINDEQYVALLPEDGEDDKEVEYVILKLSKDENGEELLVTIDDDEEFDAVADAFEDEFFSEIDYDENSDGQSEE